MFAVNFILLFIISKLPSWKSILVIANFFPSGSESLANTSIIFVSHCINFTKSFLAIGALFTLVLDLCIFCSNLLLNSFEKCSLAIIVVLSISDCKVSVRWIGWFFIQILYSELILICFQTL